MTAVFGKDSTTDEVLNGIDLSGKRVLITGSSGGLGKEAARAMAAKGAHVVLAARSEDKLLAAQADIVSQSVCGQVDILVLDLADQAQLREAVAEFNQRYDSLDMLINNAGVMATPYSTTADGLESQFGVCHVGHFLLTCLLVPALLKGRDARVVNLTSAGHKMAAVDFDDPNYQQREYDNWQAYGQAKSANVLFAVALDKRLADKGVRSFAVHPGAIAGTDLGRHMTMDDFTRLTELTPDGQTTEFKSLGAGAATSVWAATSPALLGKGGLYLEDCHIGHQIADDDQSAAGGVRAWALNDDNAERLWQLTEQLLGQSFSW